MSTIYRALLACALALASHAASALPGYVSTRVSGNWVDINNHGTLVGTLQTSSGLQGFLWNGKFGAGLSLTSLAALPGAGATSYYGLSDANEVVGSYQDQSSGRTVGFIANGGSVQVLDMPGAFSTDVRGISPDGRYVTGTVVSTSYVRTGFLLDRQTGQTTAILPTGDSTTLLVHGVTNDGRVAVTQANGAIQDFVYQNGTFTALALPGGVPGILRGITDTGYVTGYLGAAYNPVGFIAQGSEIRTFGAGFQVLGINDAGVAVAADGYATSMLLMPVPEPATVLMLVGGLAVLGAHRRRAARA